MRKKNLIKKAKEKINDFFEEEEENECEEEINLKTLIIIFLIGFIIIISIYTYTNKGFKFREFDFDKAEDRKQDNEKEEILEIINYFEDHFTGENILENSNFSEGINYWSTSDGSKQNKDSKSKRTLNRREYHSSPQSFQVICSNPPCMSYYDTKPQSTSLDEPCDYKSSIWMGIKPGTKLKMSYWYKGCAHRFSLMSLDNYGKHKDLEVLDNMNCLTKWIEKKLITIVPEGTIAIGIEIAMNSECTLLLDDIQLEVSEEIS